LVQVNKVYLLIWAIFERVRWPTAANGTNHYAVSVIINGIRPYQRAIRVGTNGTEDYTSCQFTGDPGYTCFPNTEINNTQPNFVKYHSVNVTQIGQQNKSPTPALGYFGRKSQLGCTKS
jgi:hypothetical protein